MVRRMPVLPTVRSRSRPAGEAAGQPAFLTINQVEATRIGGWDRHRHAEHEVIIAGRGNYRCTLNDCPIALARGEALVIKPGDWHEDLLHPGTSFHAVWFRLPGGLFAPGVTATQQVSRPGEQLATAVLDLDRLAEKGAPAARLDAALGALIGALIDGLSESVLAAAFVVDQGFPTRLHTIFARLPAGYLGAEALAKAAGMSRRSLERACAGAFGCGPVQAHARWRLRCAGDLLRTTDWPVRAVSETLGFANPFHFSRAFARLHGSPPAQWRRGDLAGSDR